MQIQNEDQSDSQEDQEMLDVADELSNQLQLQDFDM